MSHDAVHNSIRKKQPKTTRWLYWVECPQYSIQLKVLLYLHTSFNFLHSIRPSVTWLNSRWLLAACDWVISVLFAVFSTRVGRRRNLGRFLIPSVQVTGMTLNWFQQ